MAIKHRYLSTVLAGTLLLVSCGDASDEEASAEVSVQGLAPTMVPETTTTVAPTPSEQLRNCLLGTEEDAVVCAGARTVVAEENEDVSLALQRLAECEGTEDDCEPSVDLIIRSLDGEDISADLGPGPDEVWGPDIVALQALVDRLNQANDTAGRLGVRVVYSAATEPSASADQFLCFGEWIDYWRQFGRPLDLLNSLSEEILVDFGQARRTDDWTVASGVEPDKQVAPDGRTYAFPMTQQFSGPGTAGSDGGTAEVHGHIGENGDAYLFAICTVDYAVRNPNDTREALTEVLRRLDQAGIWEDYWVRPEIDS